MRRSKNEILEGFTWINKYFRGQENPRFQPEHEASLKVISIIENSELGKQDLDRIITIFNKVTEQPHHDGSGWLDFKVKVMYLLYECGFDTIEEGDKIRIKENMNDNG